MKDTYERRPEARVRPLLPLTLVCCSSIGCGAAPAAPKAPERAETKAVVRGTLVSDSPPVERVPGTSVSSVEVQRPPSGPSRRQTRAEHAAASTETEDRYGLDSLSRKAPLQGRIYCPRVKLVSYRGDVVPYQKKLDVYVGFVERLRRFETIVADTAIEFYGRPPAKIWHYGPNRCRRIRQWPFLISEHSLGNAIDVGGFEFARNTNPTSTLPRRLRGSFMINLSLHWTPRSKRDEIHSRFLQTLAERMVSSDALFRTILGPADRNHKGHFHLDMGPRENVVVF